MPAGRWHFLSRGTGRQGIRGRRRGFHGRGAVMRVAFLHLFSACWTHPGERLVQEMERYQEEINFNSQINVRPHDHQLRHRHMGGAGLVTLIGDAHVQRPTMKNRHQTHKSKVITIRKIPPAVKRMGREYRILQRCCLITGQQSPFS